MPELGPYGSVRGALSNGRPYRDSGAPFAYKTANISVRGLFAGDDRLLTTTKAMPKDADVVMIDGAMDLANLARAGRRLKGNVQTINLGADIFLADDGGRYLSRICHYRECRPRRACLAEHCGRREPLNDDFHVVTLSNEQLAAPPIELWPNIVRRVMVPPDIEAILLTELEPIR